MKVAAPIAAAIALWVALIGPAASECETLAGPVLVASRDESGRTVAQVRVNGEGPFRFIIDTGANRSALSTGLAERLGLVAEGEGEVHSIAGVRLAPMSRVASLDVGALAMRGLDMPLLGDEMLGGQQGLLGVDGMRGRRLYMDFTRRCVEIVDARDAAPLIGWRSAQGQLRFGSLVVVEGVIQNVRVNVLIDTGSDISLANTAFRDALVGVQAGWVHYRNGHAFTAGRPLLLYGAVITPRIRMGRASVARVTAFIGDYHIFDLWGLRDEPTVLIGMDVLKRAGAMAIDYETGMVYFRNEPRGPAIYEEVRDARRGR